MFVDVRQSFLDGPIQRLHELWRRRRGISESEAELYVETCRFGEFADQAANRRFDGQLLECRGAHGRDRSSDFLQALQRQASGSRNGLEARWAAVGPHLPRALELHIGDIQEVPKAVVNSTREPIAFLRH